MNKKKRVFSLLLAMLLLVGLTACADNKNRDASVVLVEGQNSGGEITYGDQTFSQDAETLTLRLHIRSNEQLDLTQLSQCTNLRHLSIHLTVTSHVYYDKFNKPHVVEQPAVDLTPLQMLPNLERLELNVGKLPDLVPLSRMANLKSLVLWFDGEVDLAPLAACPNLTELALGGRGSVDLSVVRNFVSLTSLRVDVYDDEWNTPDLSALSGTPRLETLSIGASRGLSDLTNVPLKHLIDINDSGNILNNLPAIDTLEHLEFSDEHLSDILPLLQRAAPIDRIVLEVGAQEIESGTVIRSADDPLLTKLVTPIPTEQLRNYLVGGGTITIVVDSNRICGAE